ncbi:MAG: DUF2723 domain-containing protein [bacterium]
MAKKKITPVNKSLKKTPEFVPFLLNPWMSAVGILVFLSAFFIYLRTLTPSIELHDSGELVSAAHVLGICHPPGYPLYCLMGKFLTTILPFANIAFRMNIFSALSASIAVMLVYFITLKISLPFLNKEMLIALQGTKSVSLCLRAFASTLSVLPGIVSSGMLMFATTFWQQAVIAEKYTLNASFTALLILVLIKWWEKMAQNTHHQSYLYLFFGLLGLSFTHHLQTIFLAASGVCFILIIGWHRKQTFLNAHVLLRAGIFFGLPLLLYLYLPIRASAHPAINWGAPDTWERFINHVMVKEYGYYFSSSTKELLNRLFIKHPSFFVMQFTPYLVGFGLIGATWLFRKCWKFLLLSGLIVIIDFTHSVRYGIHNIEDYYIPAYMVFSCWIGLSIIPVRGLIIKYIPKASWIILAFLMLPAICFFHNLYYANNHKSFFSYDYARNILMPLQNKAVLFVKGDTFSFPLWYLYNVERMRDDVYIVDQYSLYLDWYASQLKERYPSLNFTFAPQNKATRLSPEAEVYIYERLANIVDNNSHLASYLPFDPKTEERYTLVPANICHRILAKDTPINEQIKAIDPNLRFVYRYILDKNIYKPERVASNVSNYGISYNNLGKFFQDNQMYPEAISEFKKALDASPEYITAYYQLGLVYKDTGRYKESMEQFKKIKSISTNDARADYGIGMVFHKQGNMEQAIEGYKKAINLDPGRDFLYAALGSACLEARIPLEAIKAFQKTVELSPGSPDAYYNLSIAYSHAGDKNNAASSYQKALSLNPNYLSD